MAARPLPGQGPDTTATSRVVVVHRTSHYLRTRIIGRFDVRTAHELIRLLDDWSATKTKLTAFHDCTEIVDYDVDAREAIMRWSRAHVAGFDAVHLLVESRTIAWVLQIIATVTAGKLTMHHSRASFESANARHHAR